MTKQEIVTDGIECENDDLGYQADLIRFKPQRNNYDKQA
jgi:hypothetical protein